MGRKSFYYGELRGMIVAENVYNAYQMRKNSKNWAAWTKENEALANLLFEAEELWQTQKS